MRPTGPAMEQARKFLLEVLKQNKALDAIFSSKREALHMRFTLYNARKRERKIVADMTDMPESVLDHEFDNFQITIVELTNGKWACRVTPASQVVLELFDSETGKPLEKEETKQ